ncbi:MAG: DUF4286 family protein [Ignavibacteria bacterium]|nr:DUF4286 family protein [Ignavibacteria bacterium]
MIIYSVTVTISEKVESEWLGWMKEVHIPDVINIGYFFDWQMQKLLFPEDSIDEITYVINYYANSFDHYQHYTEKEAPRLQKEYNAKFKGKYRATRAVYSLISK